MERHSPDAAAESTELQLLKAGQVPAEQRGQVLPLSRVLSLLYVSSEADSEHSSTVGLTASTVRFDAGVDWSGVRQ